MKIDEIRKTLPRDPFKLWFCVSKEVEPSFFSRLTQWFQKTEFSHSLIIYFNVMIDDFVIGNARGESAQLDLLEQFEAVGDEIVHIFERDIIESEYERIMRQIIWLDGIPYSEKQIFKIGLQFLDKEFLKNIFLRPIARLIKRVFTGEASTDGIICSEYADRMLMAFGLQSTASMAGKNIDLVNPKDNVDGWMKLVEIKELKRIL